MHWPRLVTLISVLSIARMMLLLSVLHLWHLLFFQLAYPFVYGGVIRNHWKDAFAVTVAVAVVAVVAVVCAQQSLHLPVWQPEIEHGMCYHPHKRLWIRVRPSCLPCRGSSSPQNPYSSSQFEVRISPLLTSLSLYNE